MVIDSVSYGIISTIRELKKSGEKVSFNKLFTALAQKGIIGNRKTLRKRLDELKAMGYIVEIPDPANSRSHLIDLLDEGFDEFSSTFVSLWRGYANRLIDEMIESGRRFKLDFKDITHILTDTKDPSNRYILARGKNIQGEYLFYIYRIPLRPDAILPGDPNVIRALKEAKDIEEAEIIISKIFEKRKLEKEPVPLGLEISMRADGIRLQEHKMKLLGKEINEFRDKVMNKYGSAAAVWWSLYSLRDCLEILSSDKEIGRFRLLADGKEPKVAIGIIRLPDSIVSSCSGDKIRAGKLMRELSMQLNFLLASFNRRIKEGGRVANFYVPPDEVKMIEEMMQAKVGENPAEVILKAIRAFYKSFKEMKRNVS